MQEVLEGARDRKRANTYRRIHEAALKLTLRDGLTAATVDAIAERAGISRRTFFNYYDSKEDAVLGLQPAAIPPHALDAFLTEAEQPEDPERPGMARFDRALTLTVSTMASIGPQLRDPRLKDLVATNPDLLNRLSVHRDKVRELLVTVLTDRLTDHGDTDGDTARSDSARALILLASAVLRFAHGTDPDFFDDPDPDAIDHAVTAFRTALREIK